VKFVAHPDLAPADSACRYAHPDEPMKPGGPSWRDHLTRYNTGAADNPDGLFPAHRLYSPPAYGQLVAKLGAKRVYILSAGWGLVRADFLTPQYDITLKAGVEPYKRRGPRDRYADYCHLSDAGTDPVVFFGGKGYLPLFCRLTARIRAERIVPFNSRTPPEAPGCRLVRYETDMRTNWHYGCVADFLAGRLTFA
jgi:hypothetical protein